MPTELVFTRAEFAAVLPSAILFATGLLQLLIDAAIGDRDPDGDRGAKTHLVLTGVAGALLAFAALGAASGDISVRLFAGAMSDDAFGRFAAGVIILATLLTTLAAGGYLAALGKHRGEFHGLLFFGAGAMVLLAQSTNLISIFVAIETLSLAVYILAGYVRSWRESAEGAFKYFVMGAFSSGFLLLGMAFLYGSTGGSIQLSDLGDPLKDEVLSSVGILLVVIGFAFKVGAVPFHSWVPDVYQGSPALAAGWMAVAVKVASFAALLRIVLAFGANDSLARMLAAVAVVTMVLGNLAALNQTNLKRMLAYSGIAHSGYLLIPVVVILPQGGMREASAGALFYLAGYLLTTIGAFAALAALRQGDRDCDTIEGIKGLARRHPLVAVALSLSMISLAGIPLTVGFMGKLFVFRDAVENGYTYLALIGIITSIISVYYYLRPVVAMYFHEASEPAQKTEPAWGLHLTLTVTSLGILLLGIFPNRIIELSIESVKNVGS